MRDFVTCPICGKKFGLISGSHLRLHGYSSAKEFKKKFGLESLASQSKRSKQSNFMSKNNPMLGRFHELESLDLMRKNRTGMGIGVAGKYIRTPQIRNKISKAVAKLYTQEGCYSSGCWVDSIKSWKSLVWVRSTWEKRMLAVLDAHPEVYAIDVEPFSIKYKFEGTTHRYIPDFLVDCINSLRILIEVKPKELLTGPSRYARKNRAKIRALEKFTLENKMIGQIITTEQEIINMEKKFIEGQHAEVL
jgi:hypothetical protein